MAPEQVLGIRGDSRSDLFAVGVVLYEMLTGELPFGDPKTAGGLRQRLWMDPVPPRRLRPEIPTWLQEVVCACWSPGPSTDIRRPSISCSISRIPTRSTVTRARPTPRAARPGTGTCGAGCAQPASSTTLAPMPFAADRRGAHRSAGAAPRRRRRRHAVLAAAGLRAVAGVRDPGARLACVTVTPPVGPRRHRCAAPAARAAAALGSEPLDLSQHQVSFHVLESGDVAARDRALMPSCNTVSIIVMGAATARPEVSTPRADDSGQGGHAGAVHRAAGERGSARAGRPRPGRRLTSVVEIAPAASSISPRTARSAASARFQPKRGAASRLRTTTASVEMPGDARRAARSR